jgi:signal transduction histidine kinase
VIEFPIDSTPLRGKKIIAEVTALPTEPSSSGARRALQVVVLLDEEARVLSLSTGLAGSGFLGLTEDEHVELHAQLHPECAGSCHFRDLWKRAWGSLSTTDSIEWEIDDSVIGRLLRLNLTRPPTTKDVTNERRRRYALLTMTDITKHRREYQSLIKRERTLMKLLREQGIDLDAPANDDIDESHVEEIRAVADYTRKYRAFNRQAILAQELERRRIASELHDSLAQSAGVIKYNVEASIEQLSRMQPDLDLALLEGVIDQTKALVDEIRRISNNLAPSMLEDFGLCVALQGVCSEFRSPDCEVQPQCDACVDESELPDIVKFTVYRVVQEALNNIAKHSSASEVNVELGMADDGLRLSILDNGVGFDMTSVRDLEKESAGGAGLHNMRERVLATGGEYSIESAPGKGVRILATWSRGSLDLLSDETVLYGVDRNG